MTGSLFGKNVLDRLEKRLSVRFRNRALLETALVHQSFLNENPATATASNERMEFLGDAVVGLVVGRELFDRLPDAPEGVLTARRSLVVRGATLARSAARIGLGEYLLMGRGERDSGGARRASNLADTYEAVAGALYLDRGLAAAREFVLRTLADELDAAVNAQSPKDPKSMLQELAQADGDAVPEYRLLCAEGPDHAHRFAVEVMVNGRALGAGTGSRKLDAERRAARQALRKLADERAARRPPVSSPEHGPPHAGG